MRDGNLASLNSNLPGNSSRFQDAGDAGVAAVAGALTHAGARKLTTVIIPGARHEVLNETDREDTYAIIDRWMEEEVLLKNGAVESEEGEADTRADDGFECFGTASEFEI